MKNILLFFAALVTTLATYAQAPKISYSAPAVYIAGAGITPLTPTNTGGVVPAVPMGQVTTYVGLGRAGTTGGPVISANLGRPESIVMDDSNNIYVTDGQNHNVYKISAAGVVSRIAGTGLIGSANGQGTNASFNYPEGLAIDAQNNLYVGDRGNNQIRKITPSGLVTTFAGSQASGDLLGSINNARFYSPKNLLFDAAGNLYVCDYSNYKIKKITPAGVVSLVAGSGFMGNAAGNPADAQFGYLGGLTFDAAGNLYVTDAYNHTIWQVSPSGVTTAFAGKKTTGNTDGLVSSALFNFPKDVLADKNGNLYVADYLNGLLRVITPQGVVSTVAGNGTLQLLSGDGRAAAIGGINGIVMDAKGDIYAADGYNSSIRKITTTGYTITPALPPGLVFNSATGTISGTPTASSPETTYLITAFNRQGSNTAQVKLTVSGPPTITKLSATAVSPGSYIEITGNNFVQGTTVKINNQTVPNVVISSVNTLKVAVPLDASGQGITVTNPYGTATNTAFTVAKPPAISYASVPALTVNSTITPISPTNQGGAVPANNYSDVTLFAGESSQGHFDGAFLNNSFYNPKACAFDAAGNLLVVDPYNQAVRKVTADGTVSTFCGHPADNDYPWPTNYLVFKNLSGIAIDLEGNVYLADALAYKILKVAPDGRSMTTLAGSGSKGNQDGQGATASFTTLGALTIDANGNLYVIDGNRIRKISPDGTVSTLAGSETAGLVNGQGTTARFKAPQGITADVNGNIYVADSDNLVIRKITPQGDVSTFAGTGKPGHTDGAALSVLFNSPRAIRADVNGNIYVAEFQYIRRISPDGIVTTIAGNDDAGKIDGPGTAARFYDVTDLATDRQGNLFILFGSYYLIKKMVVTGYAITPDLPAGLTFNRNTGAISGAPVVETAPTNYTITAFNIAGNSSTKLNLSVVPVVAAPQITSVWPAAAAPGQTLTLTGSNFSNISAVSIGGVKASSFNIISTKTLTAIVPQGTSTPEVLVSNNYGTGSSNNFKLLTAPAISYASGLSFIKGTAVTPLKPQNSGGAVPAETYGVMSYFAGSDLRGLRDGRLLESAFYEPHGLTTDLSGNLYISDTYNSVIRKISRDGMVTTLAGSGIHSYQDGTGTAASFEYPSAIAADANGNVFVAGTGNGKFRKITPAGAVTTLPLPDAGSRTYGASDMVTDAAGNLYAMGAAGFNDRFLLLKTDGTLTVTLKPDFAYPNNSTNRFGDLEGVAIDKLGNWYVTDQDFNRIYKVTPEGTPSLFAGNGYPKTVDGPALTASFDGPVGITFDDAGNLYVTERYSTRKITPNGQVSTVTENKIKDPVSKNTYTFLVSQANLKYDGFGLLYLTDFRSNRIVKLPLVGYAINPALPAGLTFDGTTGTISGTPTENTPYATYTITGYNSIGSSSTDVIIGQGADAPVLTSFTPTTATAGTTVTLTGSNFSNVTGVNFGGVAAASFKVLSATTISAVVGNGASGEVEVLAPKGSSRLAGFTQPTPPVISAFTPLAAAENSTITLTGNYFTGATAVSFGGVPAASFTVNSATSITAVVGKSASGNVVVTTPKGTVTLGGFAFINKPVINFVAPYKAKSGDAVTLKGTDLDGTTAVTFGGVPAASFTVNSATEVTAVVGNGANGAIALTTPGGTANFNGFVYLTPPVITSFSPSSAKTGETVTITGSYLSKTAMVTFGDVPATSFKIISDNSISAVVGRGASGAVAVITPEGTATKTDFVLRKAPVVNGLAPISGGTGTTVNITGSGFTGATAVTFGNFAAASFKVISDASITAVVGTAAGETVTVTTPDGSSSITGFTFIPAPVITSFAPSAAIAGTTVFITGTNLRNATAVLFGGARAASFQVQSSTMITAVVSAGSSGAVTVVTPGGTANLEGFSYSNAPYITSFTPAWTGAGTTVTINGGYYTNATSVTFGGTPATSFTVFNDKVITAVVPAVVNSDSQVTITSPFGTGTAPGFRYVDKPAIKAGGPTSFTTGNSVALSAGTGYTAYQWLKNNTEIPGAQSSSYTATESGSYSVKITAGTYQATSDAVTVTAVYTLPAKNFRVITTDASCKGQNNGSIVVNTDQSLNYVATLTGNNADKQLSFNQTQTFNNLAPGNYNLCITVAGQPDYRQCFDLKVSEPKDLAVYATVNKEAGTLSLQLSGGTKYSVMLNGMAYQTQSSLNDLPLRKGSNTLKVITDKECQGVVEQLIDLTNNRAPYPNPFEDKLYINLGETVQPLSQIKIYSVTTGKLVWSQQYVNQSGVVQMDVSALLPGVYSMHVLQQGNTDMYKIIKK